MEQVQLAVVDLGMLHTVPLARDLVDFIYLPNILHNPGACKYCVILAPTNVQIEEYNSVMLARVDRVSRQYIATDSLKELNNLNGDMTEPQAVLNWVACH